MSRLCPLSLLLLVLISATVAGQPSEPRKPAPSEIAKVKNENDAEAERLIRERRANAQSLLISLAADATNYSDQRLRARTLARIADALWDADAERGRAMFRKAWDAAEVVDDESRRALLEEIKQQQAKRGSSAVAGRGSIRSEVLRLVARRDRKLGEEFLAKLTSDKKEEAKEAADRAKSNPFETPEAITQRLNLARQLLDADVARSIQFADPALMNITRDGVDYLSYLREKDAPAADARFAALLGRAAADTRSDANTISLLASYLFTPHVFVQFNGGGANTMSTGRNTPAPEVAPELRAVFFRAAADVFLRPLAPPGQDQTTSGVVGKYLMMKRLMPLFEQFASKDITEAVRVHMEALANTVSETDRQRDDESVREGIRPLETPENMEKSLLEKIERTKPGDERDQLYLQLARIYSQNGDMRAREIVEKVDDTEVRNQARLFTDATLVMRGIDKKDAERVVEIVRIGALTHLQKAWALTQAAKLVYKNDVERAMSLLEQADTEAKRIDTSDPDRPRALLAVANTYLLVDRRKAWDQVADVTKAANSAPTFTGEDGVLRVTLLTKGGSSIRSSTVREFDVAPLFNDLAKEDHARIIELARLFEKEGPRASATIAIARAMLEETKK